MEEEHLNRTSSQSSQENEELDLPKYFSIGQTTADGNSFFDSFRQGLETLGKKVTIEQLRQNCKEFAQNDPPKWFINAINNSYDNNGEVHKETTHSYAVNILNSNRWANSDVEGRILCEKYGVKLHVIEKFYHLPIKQQEFNDNIIINSTSDHTIASQLTTTEEEVRLLKDMEAFSLNNIHQIITPSGSRPQNNIDYQDEHTIHIINRGMNHFEPILNNNPLIIKINKRRKSIKNRELLIAAGIGKLAEVKQLVRHVDVNFIDEDGNTALHYAVESGNLEIVQFLRDKVNVSIENNDNKTPLDIAKDLGRQNIIKEIGEQIVNDSLKMLEEKPSRKQKSKKYSEDKTKDLNFSDATFFKDYTKSLTSEDVNNILKFKYIKETNKVFEAIRLKQLKEKFDNLDKQKVFIVDLKDLHWVTLVIFNKIAYYFDPLEEKIFEDIKNELDLRSIKVENLSFDAKQEQEAKKCDSGIFALKTVEKIINDFDCKSNKGKMKGTVTNWAPKDIKLDDFDIEKERKFFANILNEKKRTEDKIKSCLKILENLGDDIQQFTYKNANAFVLFLETFALEDTYPTAMVADKEEQKTLEKELKKLKKDYFIEFYFKPENAQEKPDIRLISDTRGVLLHGIKIIEPEDFVNFIPQNYNPNEFFQDLKKYTKYIDEKLSDKNSTPSCKCNDFLRQLPKDTSIGKEGNLQNVFFNFIKDVYTQPEYINNEKIEKIIFDLTVNIIPLLDNKQERMKSLSSIRNTLIHNFQHYENVNDKLTQIKSNLLSLRSDLLKYCYSIIVHDILKNISPDEDIKAINIKKCFEEKSKIIQEQFEKDHVLTIRPEDAQSFEYMFLESVFPEKDEDIKELVDQYLKFMVTIDNDEREEENQIEDKEITLKQFKELSDIDRREIFEDFIILKKISHDNNQYKEKKNELKRKLEYEYGIREGYCEETVHLYVENDNELCKEDKNKSKEIIGIINTLKQIKKDYELSNKDIIILYERFIEEKGIFDVDNLLLSYNLSKNQSHLIRVRLQALPKPESIGISTKIIRNMLEVFYNSYNKYQIKFNNIEEVFSDKTFLDYLINRDVTQEKNDKERFQFQDKNYIFMVIKKLLKVDYTAPYIAGLIIKVKNDKIIEKDDLKRLIEILLEKDFYLVHLNELLNIKSEKLNLYEEVCNKILDKKDFNVESMRIIFKESKHVRRILSILSERIKLSDNKEKVVKLTKEILKLLNSVAYELHRNGSFRDVLKILNNEEVQAIQDLMVDQIDILEAKFQIARTKNQLGKRSNNKVKLYEEAHNILVQIDNTISTNFEIPKRLLILAEIAYTKHLLKDYDSAYEANKILREKVIRFALNLPDIIEINNDYNEYKDTKRYQDLLNFSDESKKYLDVLNISSSMAYNKFMKGLENERIENDDALINYKEALSIYKKIYSDKKGSIGLNNITQTMRNIANLNSRIGTILLKRKDTFSHYQTALQNFQEGLAKDNKVYKNQKEILPSKHPALVKSKRIIIKNLCNIAYAYNMIGKLRKNPGKFEYRKALEIYGRILKIQKGVFENLTIKRDIAFTYNNLGTFEESKNLKQAVIYYKKALKMYGEVYKFQEKVLGEKHKKTLKTKNRIDSILKLKKIV